MRVNYTHIPRNIQTCDMNCGSAFEPGASRLPYYCTSSVCVPDVLGVLGVWRQSNKKKSCCNWRAICVDSKPKKKKVYCRDISRRSNVFRNNLCLCPCVITPRGWSSLPTQEPGIFFRVLFQQTDKPTWKNASASENMFTWFSHKFSR